MRKLFENWRHFLKEAVKPYARGNTDQPPIDGTNLFPRKKKNQTVPYIEPGMQTNEELNEDEPYQDYQKQVHPKRKDKLLNKGGNDEETYPGEPEEERSKSAPPGFGGS